MYGSRVRVDPYTGPVLEIFIIRAPCTTPHPYTVRRRGSWVCSAGSCLSVGGVFLGEDNADESDEIAIGFLLVILHGRLGGGAMVGDGGGGGLVVAALGNHRCAPEGRGREHTKG